MTLSTTDVVIAGAGPVGLALALDLGQQGLAVTVLDGETDPATQTRDRKANAINNRSMEYLRRLGLSQDIHARVDPDIQVLDVAFVTSLTGHELARFVNAFESSPDLPPPGLSPEAYLRVNQIDIVEIIRDRIAALDNVTILPRTLFTGYAETTDGLVVTAKSADDETVFRFGAQYLLGCDGGASTVRKAAGIRLEGQGKLASNMNVVFTSREAHEVNAHADASMYWVVRPEFNGYVAPGPLSGRMTIWDVNDAKAAHIEAHAAEYLAAAVGRSVAAEFHAFQRWHTHHLIAAEYRVGRVFIAGDAAHMHPPTCGLGMNTGLGDASNLGWKIAAAVKGWGGEALLASYQAERQPIGAHVVALANHQYSLAPKEYWAEGIEAPDGAALRAASGARILTEKATEFFSRGTVLGQSYKTSPVVVDDGTELSNTDPIHYEPTAQTGARLPHAVIDGASLYDGLDRAGLTLLSIAGAGAEIAAMRACVEAAGVPFTSVVLDPAWSGLYGRRYILVRPDHHVAWLGDTAFGAAELAAVIGG